MWAKNGTDNKNRIQKNYGGLEKMNEQKQIELMKWQSKKLTLHRLTETQKKAFCELYQTTALFDSIKGDEQK